MIIANIDIEHMHGAIERGASIEQVVDDGVPAAFLARDDYVDDAALGADAALVAARDLLQPRQARPPRLEPLRPPFHAAVAREHVQHAVARVEARVFRGELVVDRRVGYRVEVVDVGLRYRGAWQAH